MGRDCSIICFNFVSDVEPNEQPSEQQPYQNEEAKELPSPAADGLDRDRSRLRKLESRMYKMAHEFRSPISSSLMIIQAYDQAGSANKGTSKIGKLPSFDIVKSQLQYLLNLSNNLLDAKMINEGVFEPKNDKFCPKGAIEFVLKMFEIQSQFEGTTLSYEMVSIDSFNEVIKDYTLDQSMMNREDLPGLLVGDELRLKQILINLVKNALKFTKNGRIQVLASYDPNEQNITLQVIDTGCGIADSDRQKLFKEFGKLERTSSINQEGIGMGLVICKKIVEGCLGTLTVNSRGENKGTQFVFTMRMPCVTSADETFNSKAFDCSSESKIFLSPEPIKASRDSRKVGVAKLAKRDKQTPHKMISYRSELSNDDDSITGLMKPENFVFQPSRPL